MRPPYWRRAWKRVSWLQRLSGLTSRPSTVARGVVAWISSLEASPARTSPLLAGGQASFTGSAAGSGGTSPESSMKLRPGTCSSRTSRVSSRRGSTPSSLTLPKWGSMRSGEWLERPMLERPTNEPGASSWPTPRGQDSYERSNRKTIERAHRGEAQMTLTRKVKMWHTPRVADSAGVAYQRASGQAGREYLVLAGQARTWAGEEIVFASGPPDPTTGRRGRRTSDDIRVLNPRFVEALMGWPIGWTDSEP